MANPQEILDFWLADPKKWYMKDDNFDKEIATKFEGALKKAASGELDSWMNTPDGALALIILCDQFTRNMYRNSPESFAYDAKALAYSKEAIKRGHDKALQGILTEKHTVTVFSGNSATALLRLTLKFWN